MKDLWFFLRLSKPYRAWLMSGLLLSLLSALASIALLGLSGWFISAAAVAGVLAPDGVAVTFNFMQPAAQIRALALLRTVARYAERLVTHEATFRLLADIRLWFFIRIIPLTPGRTAMQRSGDMLNRMTDDIDALDALYLRLLVPLAVAVASSAAVIFWMSRYSGMLAALLLLMLCIAALVMPLLFYRIGRTGARLEQQTMAEFKYRQIDMLQGFHDLLVFQAFYRFRDSLLKVSETLLDAQAGNDRLMARSGALSLILAHLTVVMILLAGAVLVHRHDLTGAGLALFVFAVMALFEWISPLAQTMPVLGKTWHAARRIRRLAESAPLIQEPDPGVSVPQGFTLELENLGFRYREKSAWVLQNISLMLPEGSKIAITGPSGAGKSTLLHLLLRYFDPQQGRILLQGRDIREIRSEQLYNRVALLSQRSHLFAGTLRDNLLIGNPDAHDDQLMTAVRQAGLSDLLKRLPDGIDSLVGERGSRVSGGEARRIALARVYLKNAAVLLLDEPTEGLDAATEADVLSALFELGREKTVVLVTHRPACLPLVQRVYQLEAGFLREVSERTSMNG